MDIPPPPPPPPPGSRECSGSPLTAVMRAESISPPPMSIPLSPMTATSRTGLSVRVLYETVSLGGDGGGIGFDEVEGFDLTEDSEEFHDLGFVEVVGQSPDEYLVGGVGDGSGDDAEFGYVKSVDYGIGCVGGLWCEGGVVVVGAFDLDFSSVADVNVVEGEAGGAYLHGFELYEDESAFFVDVDGEDGVVPAVIV